MSSRLRLWVLLLSLVACGGDSQDVCTAPPDASRFDAGPGDPVCAGNACGGDVIGVWNVVASCAFGTGTLADVIDCAEGSVTMNEFDVRGTLTIDSEGNGVAHLSEQATGSAYVPLDCFQAEVCSQIEALFQVQHIAAVCNLAGCPAEGRGACDCELVLDDPDIELELSVVTNDERLTLTLGEEVIEADYCATADEFWFHGKRFGGVDYIYRTERLP